jgi:hypothetical protein
MNRIHTGLEAEAGLVRTAPVTDLVARAASGEKQAWDALVERYSPLIWSICLGHRLGDADADAVGLRVWRQLVHRLDEVPDPGARDRNLVQPCRAIRAACDHPRCPGGAQGHNARRRKWAREFRPDGLTAPRTDSPSVDPPEQRRRALASRPDRRISRVARPRSCHRR